MRTIIKSLLCLTLLMALIGTANAEGPPTNLIGSWQCKVGDDVVFLVNFNHDGTLTASGSDLTNSVYYGAWKRTGLKNFESKDLAFIIESPGCILETDTSMTMSDNDNFDAEATISDSCNGTEVVSFTCTRTMI
jgi:hypothetical protein